MRGQLLCLGIALAPRRVSVFQTPGNGELLNLRVTSHDKVS